MTFNDTGHGDDGDDYNAWERGPMYATLKGREVVPCSDAMVWGAWFETANRRVAETMLGRARVSTVFLGLNHGDVFGRGPALWFETMTFRGDNYSRDVYMARYATWDEAETGHAAAVRRERAGFSAWVEWRDSKRRVHVVGWRKGIVELEDGTLLPAPIVYRNRRRVPLRADTYKRRFGVVP